jgi:tRNA(His) 5'-end guanylyltransferase
MAIRDELGTRMKTFYEDIPKTKLMRRMPVAIRIDGKAFHTFTRGMKKPFDPVLTNAMQKTMQKLCENIQGCVFGYTQSDEITLILVDYQTFNTSAWFDYEVQKICSISASMATMYFNKFFENATENLYYNTRVAMTNEEERAWYDLYSSKFNSAMFDARCFNIPKEEVTNLIYWRQLDATRNSIQSVGQAYFSHYELKDKSCNDIQDMLMTQKGINWNDFPAYQKRGSSCIKEDYYLYKNNHTLEQRSRWAVDLNMPILKNEDREYVDKLIYIGEE